MVINSVSDWFQFVPLQLLSDTIEHTLHSVGDKINVLNALNYGHLLLEHLIGGHSSNAMCVICLLVV